MEERQHPVKIKKIVIAKAVTFSNLNAVFPRLDHQEQCTGKNGKQQPSNRFFLSAMFDVHQSRRHKITTCNEYNGIKQSDVFTEHILRGQKNIVMLMKVSPEHQQGNPEGEQFYENNDPNEYATRWILLGHEGFYQSILIFLQVHQTTN